MRFSESGNVDLRGVVSQLGYDASRTWQAGNSLAGITELGDFGGSFPYSLRGIASVAGFDIGRYRLSGLGRLLGNQTIGDVVQAIPSLRSRRIDEVAVIASLLRRSGVRYTAENTVNDILLDSRLAGLRLGAVNLSRHSLAALPGVVDVRLDQFGSWQTIRFSEIAGLGSLPITSLSRSPDEPQQFQNNSLQEPDMRRALVQADIVFSSAEKKALRSISGSYNEGFQVACQQERGCPHVELTNRCIFGEGCIQLAVDPRMTPLRGKQWISGRYHKVIGGSGLLTGLEPTGRHPLGDNFKMVLTDMDESRGEATFAAYFRICSPVGCSPYLIGPLPLYVVREKGLLLM